jgi:protein gp37
MMKTPESVMIRYLSVEPILDEMHFNSVWNYGSHLSYVEWVIIGAETGNRKDKVTPKKRWIENIVHGCKRKNIPVFMKESLIPIVGEENMLREFPPALQPRPKRKKSADIK